MNRPLTSADYGPSYRVTECRPNLLDALAAENAQREVALHLRRLARQSDRQRFVRAFCIAVAVFCIVYFGGRELLAVLS